MKNGATVKFVPYSTKTKAKFSDGNFVAKMHNAHMKRRARRDTEVARLNRALDN